MFWTQEVEQVFQEGKSMKDYYKLLENQLVGLTEVVRGELSNMERITVGALITIDVHARDVVDRLIKDNVSRLRVLAFFCLECCGCLFSPACGDS